MEQRIFVETTFQCTFQCGKWNPAYVRKIQDLFQREPVDVVQSNFPRDMKEVFLTLSYEEPQGDASEHCVFYGDLEFLGSPDGICLVEAQRFRRPVVVKFRKDPKTGDLFNFSSEHARQVKQNYIDLARYLCQLQNYPDYSNLPSIEVNKVFIATVPGLGGLTLWIEQRLNNYQKFCGGTDDNYGRLMASKSSRLRLLEDAIFVMSEEKRLLVDCQGAYSKYNDVVILSDVEFSDTLEKFGLSNDGFLSWYKTDRGLTEQTGCVVL